MPAPFSIWGNMGNQAYMMPMEKLAPFNYQAANQILIWNASVQALDFAPFEVDPGTGAVSINGTVALADGGTFSIAGDQVVGARRTGWVAPTGTSSRATFDTATVTATQLAERVKALIEDLTAHGLIGAA
jgi:hypothetical protein